MEIKPSLTAIVEITIDPDTETYKTQSYIEIADEYSSETSDMPRDVLLGMVHELNRLITNIKKDADINDKEMKEFLNERELISETFIDENQERKNKKDAIERTIDHLFDDESDE
jgi:hypothetical protein